MGAIPPSVILSRKGIARYGGVSRSGAAKYILYPCERDKTQDDGKGGLSLRGVAVTTKTAITAETAKTVTVASCSCIV